MKYVEEAIAENWAVPLGPHVDAFERELQQFLRTKRPVVALSSGTAALHLALVACGVGPGDEVMCQSMTFSASCNPITYVGATPVFVDSEAQTWNMDPELLDAAIASRPRKPKAIMVVHLYGMPAKIREIQAVARKHGITLIEDAAEALGSEYDGQPLGTFGHYGILSFNGNKMITTSGGGALIAPDAETRRRVLFFATQARESFPYYQHEHVGYNYRLSNISACIGLGQMHVLAEHLAHHRRVHEVYCELFANVPGISVHNNPSAEFNANFWLSTILLHPDLRVKGRNKAYANIGHTPCEPSADVEALRAHLNSLNIETRPLWKPMHRQPVFAYAPAYVNGISESLFARGLCLPSGPDISPADQRYIVDAIVRTI